MDHNLTLPTQPILTTGLNGLVGSRLHRDFAHRYAFTNLDISHPSHPIDITQADQVSRAFAESTAPVVIHFAAFTDVTAAWSQRDDPNGLAYQVNVVGTQNIVQAAEKTGKHIIHISTAFVFDGLKSDPYTELDQPRPLEWYGETKYRAEQAVAAASTPWTILRIDFPFRSDTVDRPDIVRKTVANLEKDLPLFTDHTFGPTFIDDFVKVIDWTIRTRTTGLFHASNGESWTDYAFAELINRVHQLGHTIKPGKLTEYLKTTQRPYQRNTALNTEKLSSLIDFKLNSIEQAMHQVQL